MDFNTRNGIKEITKILKEKVDDPKFIVKDNLGIFFMKLVAQNLASNHGIYYIDAVRISTSMAVDTEVLMEEDDPIQDIDDLAVIYAKIIVETSLAMYDDKTLDVEVMRNIAAKTSFKV